MHPRTAAVTPTAVHAWARTVPASGISSRASIRSWSVCTPDFGHMAIDGDLVVHTEYEFDEPIIRQVRFVDKTPPHLDSTAREDAEYLRRILADKPALQWRGRDDE